MKYLISVFFLMLLSQGCGMHEREQNIRQRELEVAQVAASQSLKEQELAIKEADLKKRELLLDSTQKQVDSVGIYNPDLVGIWSVKMKCIETNCEGSAIGDVKSEQWEVNYLDARQIIAKAFSGKKLTRTYAGVFRADELQLTNDNAIHVSLSLKGSDKMEGIREILQEDCKIIYSIEAERILNK